jgi:L-ribulose-5-phosphate 3-epimerase
MAELAAKVGELGLAHVQLALGELVFLDDKRKHHELGQLRAAGIHFTGGMLSFADEDYSTIDAIRRTGGYVPDDKWPVRQGISLQGAKLARELGMKHVMAHIGFVPPPTDPKYRPIIDRVRQLAASFAEQGLSLLMETGQEPAHELLHFLEDLNVPVKDATASSKPGIQWGAEVPFGTGQVNPSEFLKALKQAGYTGPLAIEREAGTSRMADVKTAIEAIRAAKV